MLNWILSGICVVLLVLIIYYLSKAMQAFSILHSDLIAQPVTEATGGSPVIAETPLSSLADSSLPDTDYLPAMENTTPEMPEEADEPSSPEEVKSQYIASIHGTRFHRPDCSSVKRIRDENREYFTHRDEAIASGYDPCTRCNP
jgi:hypothetical protein